MGDTGILIIEYAARTAVLTLLLCGMVKIQKLNFFFPGLLVSAAIACALDTIPYFGHYLAVPILYLCIWKVTGASLMPDAVFTVVISFALMFAVNVLLFTALIGDLRTSISSHESHGIPRAVAVAKPPPPGVAPVPVTNQNVQGGPAGPVKKNSKPADEILKDVKVKGVTRNGDKSMLLISANKKTYELVTGEQTSVQTTNGTCHLRLVNVDETWATVEVNGEAAYLRIR